MNQPKIPTLKPIKHPSDNFRRDAIEAEKLAKQLDAGELEYSDLSDRQAQLIDDHVIGHDAFGEWIRSLSDEHLDALTRGEPVPNIPEAFRDELIKELATVGSLPKTEELKQLKAGLQQRTHPDAPVSEIILAFVDPVTNEETDRMVIDV